jgi:ATP phosphoribosyltransferase
MSTPAATPPPSVLRLALPKGRMHVGVATLLGDAGIAIAASARNYRPAISLPRVDAKILKPQNIVEMLDHGSRDIGFAGKDWVAELDADLVELLDTELDPVQVVAAAPSTLLVDGRLPRRRLVVASEYQRLTRGWITQRELDAECVRSYGATEVFPPEDADAIVDNTATGATLRDNGLCIVDELMRSSTCLFASPRALDDPDKRRSIEDLVLLLRSVLEARRRVMVEVNVSAKALDDVVAVLPCMRRPTIAPLVGEDAFAVKAAVVRSELPSLVVALEARGATDIVVSNLAQIIASGRTTA